MDHKVLSIALEGMYMCNTDDKVILKWLVDHKVLSIALEGMYMCNTDDKVILKCGPQSPVYSIRGYVYV